MGSAPDWEGDRCIWTQPGQNLGDGQEEGAPGAFPREVISASSKLRKALLRHLSPQDEKSEPQRTWERPKDPSTLSGGTGLESGLVV